MNTNNKLKYKQEYNNRNNDEYIGPKKKYEPEKIIERIFNEKKEAYEYKEKYINHKLDWENQEELLIQNLLNNNEREKL